MLLNGRLQELLALGYYGAQFAMRVVRPSAPPDRKEFWRSVNVTISEADTYDLPAMFFANLSGHYSCVVEIGATDGRRIQAIRQSNPACKLIAMDLAYQTESEQDGISFVPYAIDRIPRGALVVCVGTLVCFNPDELSELLTALRNRAAALAYFEPAPVFRFNKTFRRRISSGFYHAYDAILPAHGFTSKIGRPWPYLGSPQLEKWTYGYWRPTQT